MGMWSLDRVDTPALVVDLDTVERNLHRVHRQAQEAGLALWPHTKTHKAPWLARRQLELGARGLTVAKLGEAEVLRDAGLGPFLVHYPLVGETKARRLADLLATGAQVQVALDSPQAADTVAEGARQAGAEVGVLVEVDTGMHRVGVAPGPQVVELSRYVHRRPGLRFLGLTSYAGHVSAAPDEEGRRQVLRQEREILQRMRHELERQGLTPQVVSVGGTHHAARMEELAGVATHLRPGTYVYNDRTILLAGSCREDDLAASVLVTVVSRHDRWAVVDGGSKAFSSDAHREGGYGLVMGRPKLRLTRLSEEHGILEWEDGAEPPRLGERLRIVPNHICTVVNLFDRAWAVRGEEVERVFAVSARGKSQ
jgi:D-serine deaminase-like pyridoxal phosphate-dependent protein